MAEIRGENEFWGQAGLGAHESVPPQTKLRGGALKAAQSSVRRQRTVEGKNKWHHQVFQDSFLLER